MIQAQPRITATVKRQVGDRIAAAGAEADEVEEVDDAGRPARTGPTGRGRSRATEMQATISPMNPIAPATRWPTLCQETVSGRPVRRADREAVDRVGAHEPGGDDTEPVEEQPPTQRARRHRRSHPQGAEDGQRAADDEHRGVDPAAGAVREQAAGDRGCRSRRGRSPRSCRRRCTADRRARRRAVGVVPIARSSCHADQLCGSLQKRFRSPSAYAGRMRFRGARAGHRVDRRRPGGADPGSEGAGAAGRPPAARRPPGRRATLIDDLWGDELPVNPTATLQTRVSQLRRALDEAEPGARELVRTSAGRLPVSVAPEAVDSGRFRALATRARQTGNRADARRDARRRAHAVARAGVRRCRRGRVRPGGDRPARRGTAGGAGGVRRSAVRPR